MLAIFRRGTFQETFYVLRISPAEAALLGTVVADVF
jgi:hypothetical protein